MIGLTSSNLLETNSWDHDTSFKLGVSVSADFNMTMYLLSFQNTADVGKINKLENFQALQA